MSAWLMHEIYLGHLKIFVLNISPNKGKREGGDILFDVDPVNTILYMHDLS